jgi:hypothetical protein
MEWLAVSALVDEDFPEKVFYLCPTDSVENLADKIAHSSFWTFCRDECE